MAPGTMGLLGNLWAGEIQEQLIHARTQKAPVVLAKWGWAWGDMKHWDYPLVN
jgi:hypothetical protein